MRIPDLKRIRITSADDLRHWLARNADFADRVMLVTHARSTDARHVSREDVVDVLAENGWVGEARYTLNATLLGHVIRRKRS